MLGEVLKGVYSFNGFRVEVSEAGGGRLEYIRRDPKGSIVARRIVGGGLSLSLYPIYPVFYPRFVTRFMLCMLDGELVTRPGSEIGFYLRIPYDLAVYAMSIEGFDMVDVIPLHARYKLVFYGYENRGFLARSCRVTPYTETPEPEIGYAVSFVKIVNNSSRVARLSRILLDSSPLKLYYGKGSWRVYTQEVQVTIASPSVATVTYGEPFVEGVEQIEDPPELRPPRIVSTTYMMWGY